MPAALDPGPALRRAVEALRRGAPQEAVQCLREAVEAAPTLPVVRAALGMALREAGAPREAVAAIQAAGAQVRSTPALARELGLACLAAGDRDAALPWLRHAVRLDPLDFQIAQRLVDEVAAGIPGATDAPAPAAATGSAAARGVVDIGFCSIDPAREAAARASLGAALGADACCFHVVHDARSLAEGWNRLLDRMSADVVILCHDDIEVIGEGFASAIAAALARADIVGVAGSRRAAGPAVLWAGHPHVHGWVTYPRDGALEAAPLSFESGVIEGMQALDGVFLAMRGEVARTLRFDAQTFDGFHFYDLDFSYRAAMQGLRLAVSTDIRLLHASEGHFGDAWKHYAARFMAKHPSLNAPQGSPHWYGARFANRDQVTAFYDTLAALDRTTPAMAGESP